MQLQLNLKITQKKEWRNFQKFSIIKKAIVLLMTKYYRFKALTIYTISLITVR